MISLQKNANPLGYGLALFLLAASFLCDLFSDVAMTVLFYAGALLFLLCLGDTLINIIRSFSKKILLIIFAIVVGFFLLMYWSLIFSGHYHWINIIMIPVCTCILLEQIHEIHQQERWFNKRLKKEEKPHPTPISDMKDRLEGGPAREEDQV